MLTPLAVGSHITLLGRIPAPKVIVKAMQEIKPHLVGLLSMLRREMNRPQLNCSIEVEWEEKEAVIYTPRDKYDALSAKNPVLGMFKVLFPEVDY